MTSEVCFQNMAQGCPVGENFTKDVGDVKGVIFEPPRKCSQPKRLPVHARTLMKAVLNVRTD